MKKLRILIFGNENQFAYNIKYMLRNNVKFSIHSKVINVEKLQSNPFLQAHIEKFKNGFNLIIFIGLYINNTKDLNVELERIKLLHLETKIPFLFITRPFKGRRKKKFNDKYFRTIPHPDVTSKKVFLDQINSLTRFGLKEYERIMICKKRFEERVQEDPALTSSIRSLISRINASHYMSDDYLELRHVNHTPYSSHNTEDEFDDIISKLVQEDVGYLNTIDEFHRKFIEDKQRTTHLLIGHRGCGKSSFIHYYFKKYLKDKNIDIPYIIIDFFNYRYINDVNNLRMEVIVHLYDGILNIKHSKILRKYSALEDFRPTTVIKEVTGILEKDKIDFYEIIPRTLKLKLLEDVAGTGEFFIGKMIIGKNEIDEKEAIKISRDYAKQYPWRWLAYYIEFTKKKSSREIFRFFANWIFSAAFKLKSTKGYANEQLFIREFGDFRDSYLTDFNAFEKRTGELQKILDIFISKIKEKYDRLYIAIDNVDRLNARDAEMMVLKEIKHHILHKYSDIKISLSFRPATYIRNKELIEIKDTKILFFNIFKDVASYDRHFLNPVKLDLVIEKSISSLKEEIKNVKDISFLNRLEEIIKSPIITLNSQKNVDESIFGLISGLAGNNIRIGKDLFQNLIFSNYKRLDWETGIGLTRTDGHGKRFIAEHVALRAIFLRDNAQFEFDENLTNLYAINGINNYQGTLVQIRILEILKEKRIRTLKSIYDLLIPLGYDLYSIQSGLSSLSRGRLISTIPIDFLNSKSENTSVILRFRGDYYFDNIQNNLSYIQMIYYKINIIKPLAKDFSFPNFPKVKTGELENLVECFLEFIDYELYNENKYASQKGIDVYEKINSLEDIYIRIKKVYKDLSRIKKER